MSAGGSASRWAWIVVRGVWWLLAAGAAGALAGALLGVEENLAEPDPGRRHLGALVVRAELQRLLQAEHPRRHQPLQLLGGGGADVGQLALAGDVDIHVIGPGVLTDDHALVDLGARADHQRAALLQR